MVQQQIILTTGANRGIGFAITQQTALRLPTSTCILACRSLASGEAAVQELRKESVTANLDVVELDVTSDTTILKAKDYIEKKYGRLDVLVNNAGIALLPPKSPSSESGIDLAYLQELRESYNSTFNANITSVATITSVFLPLLHQSTHGKVINISSGRASLHNSTTGHMPPTAVVSYSVSKTGMNALTVEMQKTEDAREGGGKVEFYAANPGHCKTAFNGYRGTKDPKDGAEVVVRLV